MGISKQGGVSQNLSLVTNDSFCFELLKSLLLIGYQQICHWFLSFIIEKGFVKWATGLIPIQTHLCCFHCLLDMNQDLFRVRLDVLPSSLYIDGSQLKGFSLSFVSAEIPVIILEETAQLENHINALTVMIYFILQTLFECKMERLLMRASPISLPLYGAQSYFTYIYTQAVKVAATSVWNSCISHHVLWMWLYCSEWQMGKARYCKWNSIQSQND